MCYGNLLDWKEHPMRRLMVLAAAVVLSISSSSAAELIMVRQVGWPWCAAWDRGIAPIYGKTEVGRQALLRMVDFRDRPAHFAEKSDHLHAHIRVG